MNATMPISSAVSVADRSSEAPTQPLPRPTNPGGGGVGGRPPRDASAASAPPPPPAKPLDPAFFADPKPVAVFIKESKPVTFAAVFWNLLFLGTFAWFFKCVSLEALNVFVVGPQASLNHLGTFGAGVILLFTAVLAIVLIKLGRTVWVNRGL